MVPSTSTNDVLLILALCISQCLATDTDPRFAFRAVGLSKTQMVTIGMIFGPIFVLVAVASICTLPRLAMFNVNTGKAARQGRWTRSGRWHKTVWNAYRWNLGESSSDALRTIAIVCVSRALFFFVDPYYARRSNAALVGLLYGVAYPGVCWVQTQACLAMAKCADFPSRRRRKVLRITVLIVAIGNWVAQITADIVRSLGYTWVWLVICRIYFIVWGLIVSVLSLSLGAIALGRLKLLGQRRAVAAVIFASIVNVSLALWTVVPLTDWEPFNFVVFTVVEQVMLLLVCVVFAVAAYELSPMRSTIGTNAHNKTSTSGSSDFASDIVVSTGQRQHSSNGGTSSMNLKSGRLSVEVTTLAVPSRPSLL